VHAEETNRNRQAVKKRKKGKPNEKGPNQSNVLSFALVELVLLNLWNRMRAFDASEKWRDWQTVL